MFNFSSLFAPFASFARVSSSSLQPSAFFISVASVVISPFLILNWRFRRLPYPFSSQSFDRSTAFRQPVTCAFTV